MPPVKASPGLPSPLKSSPGADSINAPIICNKACCSGPYPFARKSRSSMSARGDVRLMQHEHFAGFIFAQMPAISIWAAVELSQSSSIHRLCSTDTTLVGRPCSGHPREPDTRPGGIEPVSPAGSRASPSRDRGSGASKHIKERLNNSRTIDLHLPSSVNG
jgi:hypothetical protein